MVMVVAFAAGVVSCRRDEVYFQYRAVPPDGWNKDSACTFDFTIADTIRPYNVFIHVRHWGDYPYQNFWLFLQNTNAEGHTSKDTVECYLSDNYGKWLGKGYSVKEISIAYQQQVHFPDSGTYRLTIHHGMRDSLLKGIKEIGVRVEPFE